MSLLDKLRMMPVLLRQRRYQKLVLENSIIVFFSIGLISVCLTFFMPVTEQPELLSRAVPFIFVGAVLSLVYVVMFLDDGGPGIGRIFGRKDTR